jgi:hypothetical protein
VDPEALVEAGDDCGPDTELMSPAVTVMVWKAPNPRGSLSIIVVLLTPTGKLMIDVYEVMVLSWPEVLGHVSGNVYARVTVDMFEGHNEWFVVDGVSKPQFHPGSHGVIRGLHRLGWTHCADGIGRPACGR